MNIKNDIALSDNGFIFNPSTGDSYSVNALGMEIIQMMKDNIPEKDIIAQILEEYRTDQSTIEKDLYDFKNLLKNYKVAE
jgi:hypothetical protein